MISSCKVLFEFGDQLLELDASMIYVRRLSRQSDRWTICGTVINTRPASGKITLSENQTGLDEVTYNGLEPGEFMREWLILEPIRIKGSGDTSIPSDKIQKDKFVTDQVDVLNFQAKVKMEP